MCWGENFIYQKKDEKGNKCRVSTRIINLIKNINFIEINHPQNNFPDFI